MSEWKQNHLNAQASEFVYKNTFYDGPHSISAVPSPEMEEYHKNQTIQINITPSNEVDNEHR